MTPALGDARGFLPSAASGGRSKSGRAYVATEERFRRIVGYEQLWMLKSYLDRNEESAAVAATKKVG